MQPPPPPHTQGNPRQHSALVWFALRCSKGKTAHRENCGDDHTPVTRGYMRELCVRYFMPPPPPDPHEASTRVYTHISFPKPSEVTLLSRCMLPAANQVTTRTGHVDFDEQTRHSSIMTCQGAFCHTNFHFRKQHLATMSTYHPTAFRSWCSHKAQENKTEPEHMEGQSTFIRIESPRLVWPRSRDATPPFPHL